MEKNTHHRLSLEKWKSRQQWDIILNQWGWHISKILGTILLEVECDEKGTLIHYLWECCLAHHLWKTVWRVLIKQPVKQPYSTNSNSSQFHLWLSIPKKEKHPFKRMRAHHYSSQQSSTKSWNQSECPTTDEWILKMWYIYIMEYYKTLKKWGNHTICCSMVKTRRYYLKWCNPEEKINTGWYYLWCVIQKKLHEGKRD